MKKLLLVCFALSSAALAGCRAEGEIDPAGGVSYNAAAPR